jgi:formate dehydrogenase major subunit
VGVRTWIEGWPVYRQFSGEDGLGRGAAAKSRVTAGLAPRTRTADKVVTQIEGDPDSPVSRGRLCPKGSASLQLTTGPQRRHRVLYRRPGGTGWESLDLDTAMDMIADRVIRARAETWEDADENGRPLHRTLGMASLGGATLDNEENYLIKKLFMGLGIVQIENQARI